MLVHEQEGWKVVMRHLGFNFQTPSGLFRMFLGAAEKVPILFSIFPSPVHFTDMKQNPSPLLPDFCFSSDSGESSISHADSCNQTWPQGSIIL